MSEQTQDSTGLFGRLRAWFSKPAPEGECVLLRPTRRYRRARGWLMLVAALILVPLLAVSGAAAWFFQRLSEGPIALDTMSQPLANALSARLGGSYTFDLGPMMIEDSEHGPRLAISDFAIKGASGRPIIAAPKAEVSINAIPLLYGQISPRRLEIMDVEVRLSVLADGSVAISAGSEPIVLTGSHRAPESADGDPVTPEPVPVAGNHTDVMNKLGEALTTLLDSATRLDSPISALKRLGISRGRLVFDDQTTKQLTVFEGFELDFDKTDASAQLSLSAAGPNGRWRMEASAKGRPGEARSLDISLTDITLDELLLVAGTRDPGFDFDMPLSSRLNVTLAENGKIVRAGGRFTAGAGFFFLDDKDHEPVQVDEIAGTFNWNAASRRFDLGTTLFAAGETHFAVTGSVTPPSSVGEAWMIEGRTVERGVFGPERPNQKAIFVDRATLGARILPDEHRIAIDKVEVVGPELNLLGSADLQITDAGPHLRMKGTAGRMPALGAVRLWPSAVAPQVRAWFLRNFRGGVLEQGAIALDFDADTLSAIRRDKAPPDQSLRLSFTLSNASIMAVQGLPLLSSLDGTGVVTGHTSNFVATRGAMEVSPTQKLQLVEGSFSVPESELKPTPAAINLRMNGPLDAVADLFERDALKPYAQLPIDNTTVKGQIEGRVLIDLKLGENVPPEDTNVRASATLTNFSVEKLVGKERLEAATLKLTAERGLLRASGQGKMFGAPATIELHKALNAPTEAVIGMTLDDAARTKLGLNFGTSLTGQIGARMTAVLGQKEKPRAQVEIDFTRAAIDNLLPGYTKAAGKPAKASFTLVNDPEGPDLEQFIFDGGTAFAKGSIELDPNGAMERAKLLQVRLSPGDDMKIEAEQTQDVLKLTIRGTAVDSRPFLKLLTTGGSTSGRDRAAPAKDFEVDLKSTLVTGNNKQAASNVELKLARRGGLIRQFQLSGRFGRDAVNGTMVRAPDGRPPQIGVTTNDGGALLSFFDFYKRMEGGKLQFVAQIEEGQLDGTIGVNDFVVRNEPALQRLVTEGVAARDRSGQVRIDTNAAAFKRMQVTFSRGQGRIDLRDGVIYGPEAGTTIEGYLDTLNDRVNMTGTFVPAYGVNNLFSKIPLFGVILGGGTNEGLFGVNFRISGPATAPVLTINPLSAIAPGFLRKIFGAGEVGTSQMPAPPAAPAPAAAEPLQYAPSRR